MLRATVKRLELSIMHAQALDACVWVFHPGAGTGISTFYPGFGWLQNLKTARTLAKIGNEYGVKIAIENVPEPYPGLMKNVKEFEEFYANVDEDIGLVVDVGHANINGQIESFFRTFKDKIVHVHLSDNDGKSDQHLGIGRGTVNWTRIVGLMKDLSTGTTAVVESVEHVEESLQRLGELFA
jgi:sugar phosphate isomerase/epimerase